MQPCLSAKNRWFLPFNYSCTRRTLAGDSCHFLTTFCFPFTLTPRPPFARSDETYVIGFVVPNQKQFLVLADQYSIRGSWEELCDSEAMEELMLKAITEAALAGKGAGSKNRAGFWTTSHRPVCRRLPLQPSSSALKFLARSA